jgi:hypothetical protein
LDYDPASAAVLRQMREKAIRACPAQRQDPRAHADDWALVAIAHRDAQQR